MPNHAVTLADVPTYDAQGILNPSMVESKSPVNAGDFEGIEASGNAGVTRKSQRTHLIALIEALRGRGVTLRLDAGDGCVYVQGFNLLNDDEQDTLRSQREEIAAILAETPLEASTTPVEAPAAVEAGKGTGNASGEGGGERQRSPVLRVPPTRPAPWTLNGANHGEPIHSPEVSRMLFGRFLDNYGSGSYGRGSRYAPLDGPW